MGPNSFSQASEGGPVRGITMQSLGSTPLLPLIKSALQWKIHLALFDVCFSTGTLFTLTCTFHSSALVCLLLTQCCLLIQLRKISYSYYLLRVLPRNIMNIKSLVNSTSIHSHTPRGSIDQLIGMVEVWI